MKISGKISDMARVISLSCEKFTTVYTVALLFFFLPYCVDKLGSYVIWIMPIAALAPLGVLPVVYAVIHRYNPLFFGRYHLAMPVAGMMSGLFFVLVFGADNGAPSHVCACVLGGIAFLACWTTYRYTAFSVRVRLIGDDLVKPSKTTALFSFFGAAAAVGTLYGFYVYNAATMFVNSAYVFAAACIILCFTQYLATYSEIPKLGGKKIISFKSSFKEFLTAFTARPYTSSTLFLSALIAIAATAIGYGFRLGVPSNVVFGAVAATLIAFAVGAFVFIKLGVRIIRIVPTLILSSIVLAFVMLVVASVAGEGAAACLIIACVIIGVGLSAAMRSVRMSCMRVKPRITSGIVFIMTELSVCVAAAVAFVAAAVAYTALPTLGASAFFIGFGIAAALGLSAFLVGLFRPQPKRQSEITVSRERDTEELDSGVSADDAPQGDIAQDDTAPETEEETTDGTEAAV